MLINISEIKSSDCPGVMLIVEFTWSCRTGWTLNADGLRCNDINECQDVSLPSSFTYACNVGFSGIGTTCSDDNEYDNAKACQANAACSKKLPSLSERQRIKRLRLIPGTQRRWWMCHRFDWKHFDRKHFCWVERRKERVALAVLTGNNIHSKHKNLYQ